MDGIQQYTAFAMSAVVPSIPKNTIARFLIHCTVPYLDDEHALFKEK